MRKSQIPSLPTVVLFANSDWYLYNFQLPLANHLRSQGINPLLLSPPGDHGRRLRRAGFRWEPVQMRRRSINPIREMFVVIRLARRLREERPRLVHGFTIKGAVYGNIAARLAGISVRVATITGLGYVFTSGDVTARLLRPGVRILLRLAMGGEGSRVIFQNPDDARLFRQKNVVDPSRIRLVRGSGVDCQRFRPPEDVQRSDGALKVLLAGRLLWDKGLREYVEAARSLRLEGHSMRFLLAGVPDPGNPASVSERDVEGWGSEGAVELLGHVEDMASLLREVDILVLPSYREGVPKSLIEGAASGLPLIATDTPGCREVVADGVNGLLVPPRDSAALARGITRLAVDRKLAQRLGKASRARATAEFDIRIILGKVMAVYSELIPELITALEAVSDEAPRSSGPDPRGP